MKKEEITVDKIYKLYEHYAQRNEKALTEIFHENIKWSQLPGFPGGMISIGLQQIFKNVFDGNANRWKEFSFEIDSISIGPNFALVEGRYEVSAKNSDGLASALTSHVYRFNDQGKIISFQQYTDSKLLWDCYSLSLS